MLYAQWTELTRYNISGTVSDGGARVTLMQGAQEIAATSTDSTGAYSLINILPGVYNLVVQKDGTTVTVLVAVTDADVTADVRLPGENEPSSTLVVKNEEGMAEAEIPGIVVGGLEQVAAAQGDDILLTVTNRQKDAADEAHAEIIRAAGGQNLGLLLDITLEADGRDIGSSNDTVLEIVIPYDFRAKMGLRVWRLHDGALGSFAPLSARPEADYVDLRFYADMENGLLYIYASKFSAYALSYTPVYPAPPRKKRAAGIPLWTCVRTTGSTTM